VAGPQRVLSAGDYALVQASRGLGPLRRVLAGLEDDLVSRRLEAIRIEKPEVQTNSKDFDYLMDLTSTSAAWNSAGTPSTQAGFLLLRVNGADRYVQLFTTP